MKQTVNVNIAGIAFTLDRDCYTILTSFLDQTHQSMFDNPNRDSVLADIEVSIAEQILSVQSSDVPISEAVLIPIIEGMGGRVNSVNSQLNAAADQQPTPNMTKRLYRNSKGAMLGGVCSGMSSYFNVDVVIFRLLFVIPFFFGGVFMLWRIMNVFPSWSLSINATSFLVYMILWIVIPKASTPRQKLEMVGDRVTVETMAGTSAEPKHSGAGQVFATLLKVLTLFLGISLLVSAIVGTSAAFIGASVKMAREHTPIHDILSVLSLNMNEASLWSAALLLLPFIAIFYLILGSVLNFRGVKWVVWTLFITWLILLFGAFFFVLINIGELAMISEYW